MNQFFESGLDSHGAFADARDEKRNAEDTLRKGYDQMWWWDAKREAREANAVHAKEPEKMRDKAFPRILDILQIDVSSSIADAIEKGIRPHI